jgi:hypothetical protein
VKTRTYATPGAFKHALEAHLRSRAAEEHVDLSRLRQILVFERFLARTFAAFGDRAIAKGGVVLELRLAHARTTRDVDLRLIGAPASLLDELRAAGGRDLGDRLAFLVEPDKEHPTIEGEGMVYEGQRFRVEARLAGRLYGMSFGLDVGFGDVLTEPPDVVTGSRLLDFAGVEPPRLRLYPRETHVAEKLHAYTLPRIRENSRVKDLPDIALLASTGSFDLHRLRAALERTFSFRSTHPLPATLPVPPPSWAPVYARMAAQDELPWRDLAAVHTSAGAFLDPVLRGGEGSWSPVSWHWVRPHGRGGRSG